jgi:hypothetical protein
VAIKPYGCYRTPSDLLPFYTCATDTNVPAEPYYACFRRDRRNGAAAQLLRRLAGIAQHEQSPFVVVHEDVAAGVDRELLAPVDLGRMRA